MTRARIPKNLAARSAAAALCAALCAIVAVSPQSAWGAEPTPGTGNLSVTVTEESAAPTPAPTGDTGGDDGGGGTSSGGTGGSGGGSGNGPSGGGSSSSNGGGSGQGTGTGDGGAGQTPPGTGEVSVNGMVYVGGLESSSALSLNPGDAAVTLTFTVRNASQSTIDATADFWMNSIFGNEIDAAHGIEIQGLAPGETRAVSTQLHNAGQWTLVNAHMTLTPPATVDGVELTPVTRDALVVVFPWFLAVLLILAVLAVVLVPRLIRGMQSPEPVASSA
jgi:hypothetical protein